MNPRRPAFPLLALVLALGWVLGAASRPDTAATPGSEPDPIPPFPRRELTNLWSIGEWQDRLAWQPFRPGVEIHRLYGDGTQGPAAALLRFREAAKVPRHTHGGYEHILVLAGSQRDQNGELAAGTLAIHTPGTTHSVVSEAGCIVLAIYEKPVAFAVPPSPAQP